MFYPFRSVVVALVGEQWSTQSDPITQSGVYDIASALRDEGYNVWFADEDDVAFHGSGPVYDNVIVQTALNGIGQVAVFGHSHGGGSTHDLAYILDNVPAHLQNFQLRFTAYLDAIRNTSNVEVLRDNRLPPGTLFHSNFYQVNDYWPGDPLVAGASDNIDVSNWNGGVAHGEIDDDPDVQGLIVTRVEDHVNR